MTSLYSLSKMASVNAVHQRYLAVKLQFLEEQRGHFHNAVDDYVNMVSNAGKQLTETEGHRPKYADAFQGVERAAEFLFMKHVELSDITKVETLKFSQLLAGDSTLESELIGNVSASSSAATEDHISAESANCFLQSNRGNISARQTEQLSSQKTENDDVTQNIVTTKIVERFEKNEKQVNNIMEHLDQIKNQESQLQSMKKQLQRLSENQDTIQNLTQEVQKLSANQDKLQNLNKEVLKLSADQDKLQNLVQEVKGNQVDLQDEIIYRIHEDLEKKLTVISNETGSLREFMMSVFDKNDLCMEALSSRTESVEKATADLLEQINTKHETLETALRKEERNEVTLEELKKMLILVEIGGTEHFKRVSAQLEEFDTNYKVFSQMLATRLQPLEKLRNIFNERSKARDENVSKLQKIMNEVAAMTPKIAELEMKSPRPTVGFTAGIQQVESCVNNCVIAPYTDIFCNKGDHFNPTSGMFNAPLHGLYAVSVTLWCNNPLIISGVKVSFTFRVCIILNGNVQEHVCWAAVNPERTRTCDFGLVEMQIGDTLSAYVMDKDENTTQYTSMRFSCFRIS